jgi:hypothetical protein
MISPGKPMSMSNLASIGSYERTLRGLFLLPPRRSRSYLQRSAAAITYLRTSGCTTKGRRTREGLVPDFPGNYHVGKRVIQQHRETFSNESSVYQFSIESLPAFSAARAMPDLAALIFSAYCNGMRGDFHPPACVIAARSMSRAARS